MPKLSHIRKSHAILGVVIIVVLIAVVILLLQNKTAARPLEIPEADIIFAVPGQGTQQWGFLSLQDHSVQYLEDINPRWQYPMASLDYQNLIFRRTVPGHESPMVFGGSAEDVGVWGKSTNDAFHFCNVEFIAWDPHKASSTYQLLLTKGEPREIVLFDPFSCEVSRVIYQQDALSAEEQAGLGPIGYPSLSPDNFLAFSRVAPCCVANSSPGKITIVDLTTSAIVRQIDRATQPVWSYNGDNLAYVGADGIYVTNRDGTNTQKLVEYQAAESYQKDDGERWYWNTWLPIPHWSPDGTKLVYHRMVEEKSPPQLSIYNVYLYDLKAERESLLVENGMSPVWLPAH